MFEPNLANETTWKIGPLIPSPFGGRISPGLTVDFSQICAVVAVLTVNMGTKQRLSLLLVAKDGENPVVGAKNAGRWSR